MGERSPLGDAARPREVRAAGGVPWRRTGAGAVELAVVHRPRYDDWSLPKGKLDFGETFMEAARREVREETGLECDLGPELETVEYVDHEGRSKVVRYWSMTVTGGAFAPNDEVDELAWLTVDAAVDRLTHADDIRVVTSLLDRAVG